MADKSKISWCDATWSPVVGCSKVSDGCKHCWAERMAHRLACMGQKKYQHVISTDGGVWNNKVFCDESALEIPLHWKKPRRIFICSMGDLFHPNVPRKFIIRVLDVAYKAYINKGHIFQFLTKRPERMEDEIVLWSHLRGIRMRKLDGFWLGVTAENQEQADKRIPILLQIPAAVRFVSIEPMLGAIQLNKIHPLDGQHWMRGVEGHYKGIDWVIVGGESGPKARYCQNKWIRDVVKQCKAANVPVFIKQVHSIYLPINRKPKLIKDINQFPEDLRIRQYPK